MKIISRKELQTVTEDKILNMLANTHLASAWEQMAGEPLKPRRASRCRTEREGLGSGDQLKLRGHFHLDYTCSSHQQRRYQCAGHGGEGAALCMRPTIWRERWEHDTNKLRKWGTVSWRLVGFCFRCRLETRTLTHLLILAREQAANRASLKLLNWAITSSLLFLIVTSCIKHATHSRCSINKPRTSRLYMRRKTFICSLDRVRLCSRSRFTVQRSTHLEAAL